MQQLFLVKPAKKEVHSTWMQKYYKHFLQNLIQQFSAATWAIERASRVVIVLKPEKVVGRAWTAF